MLVLIDSHYWNAWLLEITAVYVSIIVSILGSSDLLWLESVIPMVVWRTEKQWQAWIKKENQWQEMMMRDEDQMIDWNTFQICDVKCYEIEILIWVKRRKHRWKWNISYYCLFFIQKVIYTKTLSDSLTVSISLFIPLLAGAIG